MSAPQTPISLSKLRITCASCSLRELCLPRGLSTDDVDKLAHIVDQPAPATKGQAIYRSGEGFEALYVVKSGAAKVVSTNSDGEEQIVSFALPGEIIGLDGIYSGRYHCDAYALDTTGFCMLPFSRLETLARDIPSLQHEMFRLASKEISFDHDMLLMINNRSADERLATFLYTLGQRYHRRGFSANEFNLVMSRGEIANFLGLAVETISRLLSRFKDQGLLLVEGRHVQLLDQERLHAMVHDCSSNPASKRHA